MIKNITDWEVLTPSGWSNFEAVKTTNKRGYYRLIHSKGKLEGSSNHKIKLSSGRFEYLEKIEQGDMLFTGELITFIEYINQDVILYDLLGVDKGSEYFTNDIVSHNCAFIDGIEDTFTSAQQTLSTGGQCMALSTPNGVGNWFHKTWEKAEAGENSFVPVNLRWDVHPERNQEWRDQQDRDLGVKAAAQECDCSFLSSGDTVFEAENMSFYEETYLTEPAEKRGVDGNLWIWEYPDPMKDYVVVADVSRGDSSDYSTFHIFDVENASQVGEYKGKLAPKEFGNVLVGIATEYNDALLVIENANIGWSTIEQVLAREYKNLYYSSRSDTETVESYMAKFERDKLVPGFTMSLKSRPLVIAKMTEYIRERSVIVKSKRLLAEMRVFIWKNGKAQAQSGYNDDLVMAFATGLYVRDTAIRMRQQGMDMTRAQMDSFVSLNQRNQGVYPVVSMQNNPYLMKTQHGQEDLSWLLG